VLRAVRRLERPVLLAAPEPHRRRRRLQARQVRAPCVGWRGEHRRKRRRVQAPRGATCCTGLPFPTTTLAREPALCAGCVAVLCCSTRRSERGGRALHCSAARVPAWLFCLAPLYAADASWRQGSSPMSRMRVSEHKAQLAAVKSTHITLTLTERSALEGLEGARGPSRARLSSHSRTRSLKCCSRDRCRAAQGGWRKLRPGQHKFGSAGWRHHGAARLVPPVRLARLTLCAPRALRARPRLSSSRRTGRRR